VEFKTFLTRRTEYKIFFISSVFFRTLLDRVKMELVNRKVLVKLKNKEKGNKLLCDAIDKLIKDIESNDWKTKEQVKQSRPDADQVHTDGYYFFNIQVHRTMILLELSDGEADIIWAGTHDKYEATFKNDKNVIAKWLKDKGLI